MKLEIFKNNEFGAVRVLADERGDIWFALVDVCNALDIKNPRDAKTRLKKDGVGITDGVDSLGRKTKITIINEANLYRLIFQSKKQEAIKFQDWVVEEVIPAIRKYGLYATDEVIEKTLNNPDFMIEILQELKKERQARLKAENKINLLTHTKKTYTTTEIAKELGFKSANELNKKLNELGIQYKVNGTWVLSAKYANKGYESIKQVSLSNAKVVYDRRWTQKGREFLLDLFANQDFSKTTPALQVNNSKGIQNEEAI